MAPPALVVTPSRRAGDHGCELIDLRIQLLRGADLVDEQVLEGSCVGACTEEDQAAGAERVREIEDAIERGTASESELDYNFTECVFAGHREGRVERVGDGEIALLTETQIGPHDVPANTYNLAFEVCGRIFVSSSFGARYVGHWTRIAIEASPDQREILVRGETDGGRSQVMYRVALPGCPGEPVETITDAAELSDPGPVP